MKWRVWTAMAVAVLCLPGALAIGGFNGLSLVGIVAVLVAVGTVAFSPDSRPPA